MCDARYHWMLDVYFAEEGDLAGLDALGCWWVRGEAGQPMGTVRLLGTVKDADRFERQLLALPGATDVERR